MAVVTILLSLALMAALAILSLEMASSSFDVPVSKLILDSLDTTVRRGSPAPARYLPVALVPGPVPGEVDTRYGRTSLS